MEKPNLKHEAKIITALPEYEDAFINYFQDTTRSFMSLKNELLSGIGTVSHEGPARMRTSTDEVMLDKEPAKIEMKFNIPFDVILRTDVEALMTSIDEASDSGIESLVPQIFQFIGEVCDASGQVVDGRGQPFSFDLFLELLEKIEITFNDDGSPNMPTLFIHPNMRKVLEDNPPSEEQQKQMEELISRKRDDFFAKKRTRKLY
ncbi:hypothetical protein PCCS19_50140 [Paenibacillus sp. CCS19]|uniref:hypothetical protein n=1 Tax=Paenibacillus sp. CCS19 TaxID=3158387 RepID=UPI0025637AAC|nr:hypothetical protein [Paenibacillus cellulosilyticus]GMK41955.1 hypothetical protein PCCS19_50140 [Paenibacillus cellulosilyticus]